MELKFFVKKNCEKCDYAKKKLATLEQKISFYDVESVDGLAESMLYSVQDLPAIIVTDDDTEVMAWRGGENHKQPLLAFLKEVENQPEIQQ